MTKTKKAPMDLVERTILRNQYKILAALEPNLTETYLQKVEILDNGFEGLYAQTLVRNERISKEIYEETRDILSMYQTIQLSISQLTTADKAKVNMEALQFEGFDGRRDEHYHIASFLMEDMGLFQDLSEGGVPSYAEGSLEQYKRMLEVHAVLKQQRKIYGVVELKALLEAAKGASL